MKKMLNIDDDKKIVEDLTCFTKKLASNMAYNSELSSSSFSFDWINEIEYAIPYLDNIVRNPKLILISEDSIVKVEKSKKITVESVKDLSKHTHFIEKIDKKTNEVKPSKILEVHSEETFNTYENRFFYTLLTYLLRFVIKKDQMLEQFETKNNKSLEYIGSTTTLKEKVDIELKITANVIPKKDQNEDSFETDLDQAKKRIARIKDFISSWRRSELIKSLDKAHVALVIPPIKKTNIILKNPNFQIANRLWNFIITYESGDDGDVKTGNNVGGSPTLMKLMDSSFINNYMVLNCVSKSKIEEKDQLAKYAVYMINNQIETTVSLLLSCGIKITDQEIIQMVADSINKQKQVKREGVSVIKKQFKSAMDDYLKKSKDFL